MERTVLWWAGGFLFALLMVWTPLWSESRVEPAPPPFHDIEIRQRIFSTITKEEMRECFANASSLGKIGDIRIEPRAMIVEFILQGDKDGKLKPYAFEAALSDSGTSGCWGDLSGRRKMIAPLIVFPPPDGVIVLRPDGTRQEAQTCPPEYHKKHRYGWQFCLDPVQPVPIPPLWAVPIAGVPYEKAQAIFEQYKRSYESSGGVRVVALTVRGLTIRLLPNVTVEDFTEALLPSLKRFHASSPPAIDGLPIHIIPEFSGSGLRYSRTAGSGGNRSTFLDGWRTYGSDNTVDVQIRRR